jgi:hypothetical protein
LGSRSMTLGLFNAFIQKVNIVRFADS